MTMENIEPTMSLHRAAEDGILEQVQAHLNKGCNINALDKDKMSPLHHAVFNGHKEIVTLLLEHGANINLKGQEGQVTPLHLAAVRNNKEIVELLLQKGADLHAEDLYGRKPIHYAKSFRQTQIMDLLLQYENR
jgi:ankyrin repeat protein